MNKILVVEDSEMFQKLIGSALVNYQLTFAGSAEEAAVILSKETFECILLDINLPQKDGFSLLTEVLSDDRYEKTPILCISGREEIADKVTAFSLGADDYLTKPFDPIELRARIDNKIKKSLKLKNSSQTMSVGNIHIDHTRHRVAIRSENGEIEIPVTQTEFKLLTCLANKPEQVFSREQLLVSAWGDKSGVLERVVDVHVCLLRKKLGSHCTHTVRALSGVGYKLTLNRKSNANDKKLITA